MIEVEGKRYKVVENLGYQGGVYAKAVQTEDGERVAVREAGGKVWRWHKPQFLVGPRGGGA